MKILRSFIQAYLQELQVKHGGYTGTDLVTLAEKLGVTYRGLKKRISPWLKNETGFSHFTYLGRTRPTITLDEFQSIDSRISSNPMEKKCYILEDIQLGREVRREDTLTKPTFYRAAQQMVLSQFYSNDTNPWFTAKGITLPSTYSIENAHRSLSIIFTYSNLKTYGGADIQAIYDRITKAKDWFSTYYNIAPISYYSNILSRCKHLRSLLTSIPPNQQKNVQARLIFEIQAAFIVECTDLLIDELIHRKGRIQQSMNANRQKVENSIRKNSLTTIRENLNDMANRMLLDMEIIRTISNPIIDEDVMARIKLLRRHTQSYNVILQILNDLTNGMTKGVSFRKIDGRQLFLLACGESDWKSWNDNDKRSLIRNSELLRAIDKGNEDIARLIAVDRLIEYIRHGKITFHDSYYYQNLEVRINKVTLDENEGFLTPEILEQFVSGNFVVNIWPLLDALNFSGEDCDDEYIATSYANFSDVLGEVSRHVRENIPNWFEAHKRVFREQTDGMVSMEYSEEEFSERLYDAIGFLGRNLRYRDSLRFWNLRYFIQRYVTEDSMRLELKFINHCMESLTGRKAEAVVLDTMGIDSRKKSILASYHGRYHTIGMADLRAVTTDMTPIHSSGCRSTDSEAMNIVEVMDAVQKICGADVKIYTGNGHTTTRMSAGMAFLSHGVIAAGRITHKPSRYLGKTRLKRLRLNIHLLNKVGKLFRNEPALGRVMAIKKHVYVDGINVRKLVEDLGYLILTNVCKIGIPVDEISLAVERSNHLKRKARIMEGSNTRMEKHNAGLLLLSSELVLCMAGLYHMIHGWYGPQSPINLSDIQLFVPA